eukprot:4754412-Amphidinium_carterae.1
MAELGFPGWVQVDDTSDEVNGHQATGERTQRLAQTFSMQQEPSSPGQTSSCTTSVTSVNLASGRSADPGSSSTSGSTSGTTSGKTSPIEISPTLPFTGGQART